MKTSKRGVQYLSHGRYVLLMLPFSFCASEEKKIPENWQFKVVNLFMEFRATLFILAGHSRALAHGMQPSFDHLWFNTTFESVSIHQTIRYMTVFYNKCLFNTGRGR